MKRIISTFAFLLATLTCMQAFAFEADANKAPLFCRDASPIADAGYYLTINLDENNVLTASAYAQTIAGPRLLKTSQVEKKLVRTTLFYTGQDFDLKIALESFVPTLEHPATLTLSNVDENGVFHDVQAHLVCTNV